MKSITRQAAEAAAKVLGLEGIDTLTFNAVAAAYRVAIRKAHPDSSDTTTIESAQKIKAAREARVLLTEWIAARPDPNCSLCKGSGFIRGQAFNSSACPRCQRG